MLRHTRLNLHMYNLNVITQCTTYRAPSDVWDDISWTYAWSDSSNAHNKRFLGTGTPKNSTIRRKCSTLLQVRQTVGRWSARVSRWSQGYKEDSAIAWNLVVRLWRSSYRTIIQSSGGRVCAWQPWKSMGGGGVGVRSAQGTKVKRWCWRSRLPLVIAGNALRPWLHSLENRHS